MNSEFINVFIQKQKNLINDLQGKLLLAETQLELAQVVSNKLTEELDQAKSELEKLQNKNKKNNLSE